MIVGPEGKNILWPTVSIERKIIFMYIFKRTITNNNKKNNIFLISLMKKKKIEMIIWVLVTNCSLLIWIHTFKHVFYFNWISLRVIVFLKLILLL